QLPMSMSLAEDDDKELYIDDSGCTGAFYNPRASLSLEQQRQALPVYRVRSHLLYLLEIKQTLVLVGEAGSGKSTQVPQYLVETGWTSDGRQVCVTQPRRVSAVTLASRVCDEAGWRLGEQCGYAVRFADCRSQATRVLFATDGVLVRLLARDPLLQDFCVVMVDEAHERTFHTDLALCLLRKVQRRRPDLRVIVSSATIDADAYLKFFGDSAACLSVEGRQYPVDIHYSASPVPCYMAAALDTVLAIHRRCGPGGVLVFLTGQEEVLRLVQQLREAAMKSSSGQQLKVFGLYGGQSARQQLRAFENVGQANRKVVVATNLAETSVTVPGIRYVVDCGFQKLRVFDPRTGLESLAVCPVSASAAEQRAGRAGRTQSGAVYRLYPESEAARQLPHTPAELERCDPSPLLLQLLSMGVRDLRRFNFLSAPAPGAMARACELLRALGALDSEARLTSLGARMAELPVAPMLARSLLAGAELGCGADICGLAACLQVRALFLVPQHRRNASRRAKRTFACQEGDHLTMLNALRAYESRAATLAPQRLSQWCAKHFLSQRALSRASELRRRIQLALGLPDAQKVSDYRLILRALAAGHFAQAARLLPSGERYESLRGGHPLYLHPGSVLHSERWPQCVVFTDLESAGDKFMMESVSSVEPGLLVELAPHYYAYGTEAERLMGSV
ncbi:hypothetical protein BOX15_Mlig020814g1, partial [Macrostomum lignano]